MSSATVTHAGQRSQWVTSAVTVLWVVPDVESGNGDWPATYRTGQHTAVAGLGLSQCRPKPPGQGPGRRIVSGHCVPGMILLAR